ncbi:hypothetical protein CRG98_002975 [Punica granatum]|uniref:Uncharacterized protein n=1 Tax=Punica granatum TaxID=22663 RepID=A0A2I0L959_PUNGR|nr:hypothetical protein CRG98_002975 [Punica granatum]
MAAIRDVRVRVSFFFTILEPYRVRNMFQDFEIGPYPVESWSQNLYSTIGFGYFVQNVPTDSKYILYPCTSLAAIARWGRGARRRAARDVRAAGVIATIDRRRLGDAADGATVLSENGRPIRMELWWIQGKEGEREKLFVSPPFKLKSGLKENWSLERNEDTIAPNKSPEVARDLAWGEDGS